MSACSISSIFFSSACRPPSNPPQPSVRDAESIKYTNALFRRLSNRSIWKGGKNKDNKIK